MGLVIFKEMNLFLTVPETRKSEVKVPAGLVSAESWFDHFQDALNMRSPQRGRILFFT